MGRAYLKQPLHKRRRFLERFARLNFRSAKNFRLSPATTDHRTASKWFKRAGGDLDGVIAKRLNAAYASGERTAMMKVKRIRTADCVVGGFRYARGTRVVGSLLLGLYGEDGLLHHVGLTSAFKASERRGLTKKFEALKKHLDLLAGDSGTAQGFFAGAWTTNLATARWTSWSTARANRSRSCSQTSQAMP